jgi:hypothetical protein
MPDIKYEISKVHTHILSTFPLVGEDVKSAAMVEFRKIKRNNL